MKKLLTAVAAVLIMGCITAQAQTNWVTQSIDERASIKFPQKPEKMGEAAVYRYKGADSITYVSTVTDMEAMGLDSATLTAMAPTQEFMDQMKTGMSMQMKGVSFSKSEITTWKGYTTYDFEGEEEAKKTKVFLKTVFVGSKMYVLLNNVPPGQPVTGKDTFFSSFTL